MTKYVAFDTETFPIIETQKAAHLVCPRMVCLQWCDGDDHDVLDHETGAAWFIRKVRDDDVALIGHNVAFDLAVGARAAEEFFDEDVSEAIFDKLTHEQVYDTMLNDQLNDIGRGGKWVRGGYGLDDLVERHLGEDVEGKDDVGAWRTRYNELFDVPPDDWPEDAYEYARLDPIYTYRVWEQQDRHPNEHFQTAAGFAMHLITCHGMRVDYGFSKAIDNYYAQREDTYTRQLEEAGIIVDGTLKQKKKRRLVAEAWEEVGEEPNFTPTGNIQTDKDTLKELEEKGVENPLFKALIRYNRATKFRSTYLDPILDAGEAGLPLCPRYNTLVDSGRTSSSGPNIQNFPSRITVEEEQTLDEVDYESQRDRVEDGVVVGPDIRGCLKPRPGKVLVAADYSALEMATLAQVIVNVNGGEITELGKAINEGKDLHCIVASTLTGESYEACYEAKVNGEDWIKRPRRVSKVINYSRPVGAGAETIQGQLRQQGVTMSIGEVEDAIAKWNDTWPDMRIFENYVQSQQRGYGQPYWIEQHGPMRATSGWRLRMVDSEEMAAAMNTLFQGLAGDGAKMAGIALQQKCWRASYESVLYDHADVWAFIHDEYVLECDEDHAEACGVELSETMETEMSKFVPDIEIEAEFDIFEERWQK